MVLHITRILFLFYESPILHHLVVSCPRYNMLPDLTRSPQQPSSIIKAAARLKVTTYRCEKAHNTTFPSLSDSKYVMMPTPADNSSIPSNTSHPKGRSQITPGSNVNGQVFELVLEGAHATRWAVLTTLLRAVGEDDASILV